VKKKSCFWGHDWSKWEQYSVTGQIQRTPFSKDFLPYEEERQVRICNRCGKKQDEAVR